MRVGHKIWILIIVQLGLLCACGSTSPDRNASARGSTSMTGENNNNETTSNEQFLNSIEQEYSRSQNIAARNADLLILADRYIQQNNCTAANNIIKHTQASIQIPYQLTLAKILKAECALTQLSSTSSLVSQQASIKLIQKWLNQAIINDVSRAQQIADTEINLRVRKQIAQARLYAQQNEFERAIDTLLSSENNTLFMTEPVYRNDVWSWFSQTEKPNRARLTLQFPILRDYQVLINMVEDDSINDNIRQQTIAHWLTNNPDAITMQELPEPIQAYLTITSLEQQRIAVLLPLSGRLSGQGEAVKEGLLSAYYTSLPKLTSNAENNAVTTSIEFIDTGSFPTLSDNINTERLAEFDTVIGPLLKSHVDQLSRVDLSNKRLLLLNQPSAQTSAPENLYASFALSPEQEAVQLVTLMRSKQIKNPVLIRDDSSITDRMLNAFVLAWQQTSVRDNAPQLQQIRYTDNKNMRIGITDSLDVLQSQKRIQQMSNLISDPVQSVTRNRRDIDAFAVFARPDDVELINPIIETSISLFSDEQLPVFATSYSYNHKQNRNSLRDLRNLVFTDIPWLLPQARQQTLSVQVDQLLNQPPSGFLRLFAFGYDALAVVDNLAQLSTFSHMSINGLSGKLSIDSDNRLIRNLASIAISDVELSN